ncbi:hypothetical protein GO755_36060 [Spirosoma sp. HMF4905]|uniref:Uncharacterized protein n=1 Tax=Spirosoma arboris TaxID=2682092 RepID=A0A7K1SP96_9BACT|nr:hypothetical protein [Spirosoma arboris]MVM35493.1 hypothetical protein [Spirosoma arboris]
MKTRIKLPFFAFPNRYCFTVPVSATGSLWAGYGGWRYLACSFALRRLTTQHKSRKTPSACQFIAPDVDYTASPFSSRPLRSQFQTWTRIDEVMSLPIPETHLPKMAA